MKKLFAIASLVPFLAITAQEAQQPPKPQDEANPGYGHVHGALRAGTDRGQSVLNGNCESHEVEGLYVLDAAWMPTAGASNPSLTLIANAYRVSEKITKP